MNDSGLWLTLDMNHAEYSTTKINSINPGLRLMLNPTWSIAGRFIQLNAPQKKTPLGKQIAFTLSLKNDRSVYFGAAHSPETTDGITLQTISYFSGFIMPINEYYHVRFDYSHEERENSYTRDALSSHVSYQF